MTVGNAIPTIDISPYLDPGSDEEAKHNVIEEVESACSTYGFLQVKGHGVPIETQQAMLRCCKLLFDLPVEEKEALSLKNNPARRSAGSVLTDRSPR
jgi:isopenicillin N synthase-like dioxygenase